MDYHGKLEKMCKIIERGKLFVRVEHFWDLLFQLMKHGTNTLHVACIYFFQNSLLALINIPIKMNIMNLVFVRLYSQVTIL